MFHSALIDSTDWERRLTEKVANDPDVAAKLAELMGLDQFLMQALQANPDGEYPEMQRAWSLCIQIARKLGLPEDAGADWLSYQATPIGGKLGIMPVSAQAA